MHNLTCHLLAYSSKSILAQLSNGFKILIGENLTWPEILTDKVNLQASFLILVHEIKKKKKKKHKRAKNLSGQTDQRTDQHYLWTDKWMKKITHNYKLDFLVN